MSHSTLVGSNAFHAATTEKKNASTELKFVCTGLFFERMVEPEVLLIQEMTLIFGKVAIKHETFYHYLK